MVKQTANSKIANEKKKSCFIITPIDSDGSETRREIEGIIDEVINPVLNELGYEENGVAHRKDNTASITADVMKSVYEADLCIANLSGNNPNVMYELALRHASGKHVIIITKDLSSLPFDINAQRAIEYRNDIQGALDLKKQLKKKISYIEENANEISNPIYDNLKKVVIDDSAIPTKTLNYDESFQQIFRQLELINMKIQRLSIDNKRRSTANAVQLRNELEMSIFIFSEILDSGRISEEAKERILKTLNLLKIMEPSEWEKRSDFIHHSYKEARDLSRHYGIPLQL